MTIRFKSLVCALALMLAAGAGAASAGTIHVAIDTATFGAATGYVDMQLSASSGVPLATALVSNMVGFDSSAFIESWGVTPVAGGYQPPRAATVDIGQAWSWSWSAFARN